MRIKILQSKPQPQIAVEVESAEDTTAIKAVDKVDEAMSWPGRL
jgi:hypothetical protein